MTGVHVRDRLPHRVPLQKRARIIIHVVTRFHCGVTFFSKNVSRTHRRARIVRGWSLCVGLCHRLGGAILSDLTETYRLGSDRTDRDRFWKFCTPTPNLSPPSANLPLLPPQNFAHPLQINFPPFIFCPLLPKLCFCFLTLI
jgi:hypothetical protein